MPGWSLGEAFYFLLTPFLVGWALYGVGEAWFDARPGALPLIIALPYLLAGYQRTRPVFALVGAAALGLAAWQHWSGVDLVWALLGLTLLWSAAEMTGGGLHSRLSGRHSINCSPARCSLVPPAKQRSSVPGRWHCGEPSQWWSRWRAGFGDQSHPRTSLR
jgi:hypothetical protein